MQQVKFQKPSLYNQYLPFNETVQQRGLAWFDEIRENLSCSVQAGELRPGFSVWSQELHQYLSLYGFNFVKADHLKLVQLYLSILSNTDLNYSNVQICFDRLYDLLRYIASVLLSEDDVFFSYRQKDEFNRSRRVSDRLAHLLPLGKTNVR